MRCGVLYRTFRLDTGFDLGQIGVAADVDNSLGRLTIFVGIAVAREKRGSSAGPRQSGLRRKSCVCYRFIRQQYEDLHAELPRLLSGK